MKKLLTILLFFFTTSMMGQDSLSIKVKNDKEFPKLGIDYKGRKYFVMSTKQDKAALIALTKGLYLDSILTRYEEMEKNCDEQILQLNGRLVDKDAIIAANNSLIGLLNDDNKDLVEINKNLEKNVSDLKEQLKKKRVPKWAVYAVIGLGSIVVIDALSD